MAELGMSLRRVLAAVATMTAMVAGVAGSDVAAADDLTCDEVVAGGERDAVIVPPGGWCELHGVVVMGDVLVEEDATLLVAGGTEIWGGITARGGWVSVHDSSVGGAAILQSPRGVDLCGSTFGGSVFVLGAWDGPVTVGGDGCGGNAVGGAAIIHDNRAVVTVAGNEFGGSVMCGGNNPLPIVTGNVAASEEGCEAA